MFQMNYIVEKDQLMGSSGDYQRDLKQLTGEDDI